MLKHNDYWEGDFHAMGSPGVFLIEEIDEKKANQMLQLIFEEIKRIELKYSRYRQDSIVSQINQSKGKTIQVDDETALLLDYADRCYQLSNGLFDITSGILRQVWNFGVSREKETISAGKIPQVSAVNDLLPRINWEKITWKKPFITLPEGMEIDFGGIGKEYAVDRSAQLVRSQTSASFVINAGGDIMVSGKRKSQQSWRIGIESPREKSSLINSDSPFLLIEQGGVATSGDSHRYIEHENVRYGHILNPRTGWPPANAPKSVSVCAETCLLAGMLATFAMLKGKEAESFLQSENITHVIIW